MVFQVDLELDASARLRNGKISLPSELALPPIAKPIIYSPRSTAIFLFFAWPPLGHAQGRQSKGDEVAASASIEGLVRDIACPIQNKEATATTFNLSCAIQCARRGSPLIILTKEAVY